jgi:hypothetical protein
MSNTLKFGNGEWYGKEGTILAYNSENNNYKPLPFTFERASSATRVNKQGLIETVGADQPRVDYLNNTNGALLLEPSRTNLVTKSENIQDWNRASNASAEFGYEDPFKGNNAVKLTSSSTAQSYQVYQSSSALSSGTTYTFSMYAKKGTGHIFRLDFGIPDNGFVHIDLRDGSLLQESGSTYYDGYSVTPISNGWYRISMTATFNSSAYYRAGLYNQQGDCYVAFAQIEAGSYATSYIPTSGSAVTRAADSCSQTVPDGVIGQTEGTMYAEIDFKSKPEVGSPIIGIMTLNNNVTNLQNCIILGIERQSGGVNRFYPFVRVGNSDVAFIIGGTLTDGNYKVAFAYKQNDFILYVNGAQIGTDTNGAVPTTSQVLVGERYNGDTFKIADGIKETKLYNTRLSNAELAALTT